MAGEGGGREYRPKVGTTFLTTSDPMLVYNGVKACKVGERGRRESRPRRVLRHEGAPYRGGHPSEAVLLNPCILSSLGPSPCGVWHTPHVAHGGVSVGGVWVPPTVWVWVGPTYMAHGWKALLSQDSRNFLLSTGKFPVGVEGG